MKNISCLKVITLPTILWLAMLALPTSVSAHATPISYSPEASSIFKSGEFPKEIVIKFTERLEPEASSIIVYAPDGTEVGEKAIIDPSDQHILRSSIKSNQGAEGSYAVSWQVVSADDGHFTKGAFVFSIGRETKIAGATGPQTQFNVIHLSTYAEGFTIFVELLGHALLIGIFGLFLFVRSDARMVTPKRLVLSVVIAVIFVIAGVTIYFFANSSTLSQAQNIAFNDSVNKFTSTVSGSYALYRGLLAIVLLFVFLFSRKAMIEKDKVSVGEIICIILIFGMTYMRARVSHAAASNFYPSFGVGANFFHLLFKELWIGGLIAVMAYLPALRNLSGFDVRKLLIRFSRMTSLAIAIAGVTGFYIIWLHLKDPKYISTTDWGFRFIQLTSVAIVFIGLRFFHQFFAEYRQKGVRLVRYTLPLETIVGIFVLLFTSFLIITTPPVEQTSFQRSAESQGAVISMINHAQEHFQIDIVNKDGTLPDVIGFVVTLYNDDKNIGPVVAKADKISDGEYFISQKELTPSGKWRMEITAQRKDQYDANAVFDIDYPKDILSLAKVMERHFGNFEILSIFGAIVVLAISLWLYKLSSSLLTNENVDKSIGGVIG